MNTKLTLSLNKEIIEQAKAYARSKDLSLSKVIEDLLKEVILTDIKFPDEEKLHPTLKKLSGSLANMPHANLNYKQLKELHFKDKLK